MSSENVQPVPAGYHSVTPWIVTSDSAKAIAFIEEAFGGTELDGRFTTEEGRIDHAEVRVGDSVVMLFDSHDDWPVMPALLRLFIAGVDAVFERAIAAGAAAVTEPRTHAWGDRVARVRDPLGNIWWLQERLEEVPLQEMGERLGQPEYLEAMRYTQETLDHELSSRR
jgi:uncharacterized glyoxalase superfamily protein PhnB